MLMRILRRFPHALRGLFYALRNDFSFRSQVVGTILVSSGVLWYASPLSETELILLLGSAALILITELQNSAIEAALDHLHPELHPEIGKSKDMAAGAVLIAGLIFALVVATIILSR